MSSSVATTDVPWLTLLIVWPLVGALVLWLLPRGSRAAGSADAEVIAAGPRRYTRQIALGVALVEVALGVGALLAFDTGAARVHQLSETHAWISQLGVSYAVGVDGVGLALVLLSVVLVPVVILAAWREQGSGALPTERLRHYLALVLVLTAFMVAVFAARDVFLFYVLFEAMLIPVYFMIGAFGGPRRRYSCISFTCCSF